ncbi:MAG: hypothetical protein M3O26_05960 [Pseudomonadota bacterium]|nr:hypothetical protein [Pseudomonadota bacterium]
MRSYYQTLEADSLLWLGEAQVRVGELSAATINLERALQLRKANDDENSVWIAQVQIGLANCLLASDKRQQAQALLAGATAILDTHRELGDQFKKPLKEIQARLASR